MIFKFIFKATKIYNCNTHTLKYLKKSTALWNSKFFPLGKTKLVVYKIVHIFYNFILQA